MPEAENTVVTKNRKDDGEWFLNAKRRGRRRDLHLAFDEFDRCQQEACERATGSSADCQSLKRQRRIITGIGPGGSNYFLGDAIAEEQAAVLDRGTD